MFFGLFWKSFLELWWPIGRQQTITNRFWKRHREKLLLRRPGSVKNARADGQEGPPLIWWTALPAPPGVHLAPGREHVKTTLSPARGAIFTGHSVAFSHHFAFFLMLDVPIPSQTPLRGLTGHLKCPLVRHRDPHMLSETPFCTLQGPQQINFGTTLVPTHAVLVPFWYSLGLFVAS